MSPDEARWQDTRAWLGRARTDVRAAEHDLRAEPPLLEDVVFHAQQAAEKAMKAFLAWHDKPFRKTHSLEELGALLSAIDPSLGDLMTSAAPLTEYAWKYRYPGEAEDLAIEEAESALSVALEVLGAVVARLPEGI